MTTDLTAAPFRLDQALCRQCAAGEWIEADGSPRTWQLTIDDGQPVIRCTTDGCNGTGPEDLIDHLVWPDDAPGVPVVVALVQDDDEHPGDYFQVRPAPATGTTSDGRHSFDELYLQRASLMSAFMRILPPALTWRSRAHHPDDHPIHDGYFLVGIDTPLGQATHHCPDDVWSWFDGIRDLEYAPRWDGHTPAEAMDRINRWVLPRPFLHALSTLFALTDAVRGARHVLDGTGVESEHAAALRALLSAVGPFTGPVARVQPGRCRACGCTESWACPPDESGVTCSWVDAEQTLCSRCKP